MGSRADRWPTLRRRKTLICLDEFCLVTDGGGASVHADVVHDPGAAPHEDQREWAAKNPRATLKAPITVEYVLNSIAMISTPNIATFACHS
jgi:hypothetical protein